MESEHHWPHHGLGVGVPGDEDAGGGHVADVEAADRGQGAELRRGGGHQGPGLQGGGARAARPGLGSGAGRGQPLPVLGEPQLLGEALARAQDRVVCNNAIFNSNMNISYGQESLPAFLHACHLSCHHVIMSSCYHVIIIIICLLFPTLRQKD